MRVHVELVTVLEPLLDDVEMQLAHAIDDEFMRLGVSTVGERGVLVGDLGQAGGDLGLVLAGLGLNGSGHHRGRERDGVKLGGGVASGVAHRVGDVQVVELGNGHQVARDGLGDFLLGLALHHVNVAGLGRFAGAEVDQGGVGGQASRKDSQIIDLAHERVVRDPEDLGHEGAVLGGSDFHLGLAVSVGGESVDVVGREAAFGDEVQKLLNPDILPGGEANDRHDLRAGDGPAGGLTKLLGLDRLAFEVAGHEVVVGLDDLLDEHLVRFAGRQGAVRGDLRGRFQHIQDAREVRPLPHRHVERHADGAEGGPDGVQVGHVVDVVRVHLGDGDEPAQLQLARFLENPARVDLDAGGAGNGDQNVLNGGEGGDGAADEVGIAGRIDQVDLAAMPFEVAQMAIDREMPAFFLVIDVEQAGAVVGRALAGRSA